MLNEKQYFELEKISARNVAMSVFLYNTIPLNASETYCDGVLALKPQDIYYVIHKASPRSVMVCIPKRVCYVCNNNTVKGERTVG